ncbi:gfo/Idh/MocA family oxidoreductase [bacterium]|nr:MAG: gfo/Idh/MocA family oxidoreductase [bacterium]
MRVAIIGAGLQGKRRAPVVKDWPGAELIIITSANDDSAKTLAAKMECEAGLGWENVVKRSDIDVVLVCTPPDLHAAISIAAMKSGKHVLCEKPLTRTVAEAEEMLVVAQTTGVTLKCGFNHRHHPAIWKAKQLCDQGGLGRLLFGRCVYGICGRPGYEQEWRADPGIVAGGQFMEQGIHAVDLFRWFFGDFQEATGFMTTSYFKAMPLEDNGFALLRAKSGAIASIHSSLTQWKNLFNLEIYGSDGYIRVEGLGGGYGNEKLIVGKRDFDAPFSEQVTEFRGDDRSWLEEWKEFVAAIQEKREPIGSAKDGLEALKLVYAVYEAARTGLNTKLKV